MMAAFIAVGGTVALGLRYASRRTEKLSGVFEKAPYASAAIVCAIGVAMTYGGHTHLMDHAG